jgi:hypothetical protein
MNNRRRITILLAKSSVLSLIIVLVGCIPATTSPSTFIDTAHSNESQNGFSMDGRMLVTGPHENADAIRNEAGQAGVSVETCDLSFLSIFSFNPIRSPIFECGSLVMGQYEFPVNAKIEDKNSTANELRNEQDEIEDPNYLTSSPQDSAANSLPNSGGGGGGGRRKTPEME